MSSVQRSRLLWFFSPALTLTANHQFAVKIARRITYCPLQGWIERRRHPFDRVPSLELELQEPIFPFFYKLIKACSSQLS